MTHRPKPKFGWYRSEAAKVEADLFPQLFEQIKMNFVKDIEIAFNTPYVTDPKYLYGDTRKYSDGTVKVWNCERWVVRPTEI